MKCQAKQYGGDACSDTATQTVTRSDKQGKEWKLCGSHAQAALRYEIGNAKPGVVVDTVRLS